MLRAPLTGVFALWLAGCSLAPDYLKPQSAVPESWPAARSAASEEIPTDWWRAFDDPALVALVDEALGANANLQLAAARVAEARALLTGRQAERYPLLEVEGAAVRQGPSEEAATSAAGRGKPFTDLRVSSLLSYELDLWGRLANASEAARARLLASAANREAVRLAVVGEVANGYFNLRALDRQIEIAERTVASRRDAVTLQRNRFEGGDVGELTLRQAELELAAAEAELPALRQQRALQRNALAVLLGRSPREIVERAIAVARPIDAIDAPASIPAGRPADLIVRRPDIAAAEQEVVATNAEIGVARAAFLPTFRLSACSDCKARRQAISSRTPRRLGSSGARWSGRCSTLGGLRRWSTRRRQGSAKPWSPTARRSRQLSAKSSTRWRGCAAPMSACRRSHGRWRRCAAPPNSPGSVSRAASRATWKCSTQSEACSPPSLRSRKRSALVCSRPSICIGLWAVAGRNP